MNNTCCFNCGAKSSDGIWLTPLDNKNDAWACDECMAEQARIEEEGCELADQVCCAERARIIATAQTTYELVNRLKAHDQAGCIQSAPVGKCDDCGGTFPQSDLVYDLAYRLHACPTCHGRQLRHDAIIERHNAEVRRVA